MTCVKYLRASCERVSIGLCVLFMGIWRSWRIFVIVVVVCMVPLFLAMMMMVVGLSILVEIGGVEDGAFLQNLGCCNCEEFVVTIGELEYFYSEI